MRLEWRIYSISKSGNRPDENEDASYPEARDERETKDFRCALSDGATSASFSGLWARLLVETGAKELLPGGSNIRAVLGKSQASWNAGLQGMELPWHALEKSRQGAFATLLWFRAGQTGYSNKTLGVWQALAAGDTCFFQMRDGKLQAAFPVQASAELKKDPFLLSSLDRRNEILWRNNSLRKAQGAFEGGDEFLFMTDALAGWFLKELEDGRSPAGILKPVFEENNDDGGRFASLVRKLRSTGSIKNDDTTLGYLKIYREENHLQERGWN